MVHQDAPHLLTGHREKMPAVLDLEGFGPGEAHIGLMHQGRGLQRMPLTLMPHLARSDAMQFVVNQPRHFVARFPVAAAHPVQQGCDIRRVGFFRLLGFRTHFESVYIRARRFFSGIMSIFAGILRYLYWKGNRLVVGKAEKADSSMAFYKTKLYNSVTQFPD